MTKLSIKDMKILQELDFAARQPISQIARKVGLSPEVTAYKIKQLENKGIITGYYPVIDLSKLGYLFCRMVFQLEKVTPEIEDRFFKYMDKNQALGWVLIADNWRVIVVGYALNIEKAKELCDEVTAHFQPIIRKKYLSIATKIYHFKHKYLYNNVTDEQLFWGAGSEGKTIHLDELDRKILYLLSENARLPATEMATKVGLTSAAVINRIRKMESSRLIQGYRFALDLKKLGYTHVKTFLYLENLTTRRKIALIEFIRRWLYSVYITEAFGKADLEFECHVPTLYLLEEYLKKMCKEFTEVKGYENIVQYRESIRRYMPEEI